MIIKQLTVFLENKSGRLAELTKVLGDNDINISALSIADTSEYGLLRLIVSDGDKAVKLLKEEGFSVNLTKVICLSVAHIPGALHKAVKVLADQDIGVEYMYAYLAGDNAAIIMKLSDCDMGIEILKKQGIDLVKPEDVYNNSCK